MIAGAVAIRGGCAAAFPVFSCWVIGGGRGAGLTPERQRSQQTLVAAQVALALVLLVSPGLMLRSVEALRRVEPGFLQPEHLQTFRVSIPATMVAEPERVTRTQQEILDRIAAIPGVASAAFTTRLPMGSDRSSPALAVEGRADDGRTPPNRQVKIVSPGLFRTQGTRLVAGRDFTWTDVYGVRRTLLDRVREAVWSVGPALPLAEVRTLDEVYRRSLARTSFSLVMLAVAGTMALLLGLSGIYGAVSYSVSQRRT